MSRPLPAVEARREFDSAIGAIRDPALVEALRPSQRHARFRVSLFPVLPDDRATVTLAIAVPRVQRVMVDVAGDRLIGRPDPSAATRPGDLVAIAAQPADDSWSLYAGPGSSADQPRSTADIRDHVRGSRERIRSCRALSAPAGDAVTLHFTVTAEGQVTDATVDGDAAPEVRDCLGNVVASWQFEAAATAVQVNYPIRFLRARTAAPPAPRTP